jgi:DsbC/DsbD-like thiol-disulfide interchange protein
MAMMLPCLKGNASRRCRPNVIFHCCGAFYCRAMTRTPTLALTLALSLALPLLAGALPSTAQTTSQEDVLAAEILPGWRTDAGTHMAALHLRLAPEWKTYWRSPGDSGIAPLFDWSGSENLAALRIHWPVPAVFHVNGLQSIGYHDELVLPLEITPRDPALPVILRAGIDLGVCRDICMPAALALQAELPAQGARDEAIAAALQAGPATAHEAGLVAIFCTVTPIADGLRIAAEIDLADPGSPETVVFESGRPDVWVAEAETRREGSRLFAVTEMVAPSGTPFALDRSAVTVTVLMQGRGVEISGCPAR